MLETTKKSEIRKQKFRLPCSEFEESSASDTLEKKMKLEA